MIKMAMVRVDRWLMENHIKAKMIMQVHDELVFEVGKTALADVEEAIRQHMSEVVNLRVPLLVSVGTGDNWDEASSR